jgi:REP element-mobilizing transposase RayT
MIDLPPEILEKMLNNASACTVALHHVGADQFAVIVGGLSTEGAEYMCRAINKYWPASSQHDLNRIVGLYLDDQFYYLYAKFLPQSNNLLTLLFTPHTPLVRIRQDMTNVMRHVLGQIRVQMQKGKRLEQSLQFMLKFYPAPGQDQSSPPKPGEERAENDGSNNWFKGVAVPDQNNEIPSENSPGWQPILQPDALNAPSTNLQSANQASGEVWVPLDALISDRPWTSPNVEKSADTPEVFTLFTPHEALEPTPAFDKPPDWQPLEETSHPGNDLVRLFHEDFDLQKPGNSPMDEDPHSVGRSEEQKICEAEGEDEETRPHPMDWEDRLEQIKLSDITFYLVPRQVRHCILGELAQRLRNWFPGICKTYGWQLDTLSVRPDYLKWRLRDFPDALIHEMLEIVRARTSQRIFRVFPNLKAGNPTRDFWSQGYLVDRQNRDFSTQILIAHIAKGRKSGEND